jgi:hypothetical protein
MALNKLFLETTMQNEPQLILNELLSDELPAPLTDLASLTEVNAEISQFLLRTAPRLQDALLSLVLDGGAHLFKNKIATLPVIRTYNLSGYNYAYQNKMLAQVRFGLTKSGCFLILAQVQANDGSFVTQTSYYHADGSIALTENGITEITIESDKTVMEPHCPILNHLYNILSAEYTVAAEGKTNTQRVFTIEQLLRRLQATRKNELSVSEGVRDGAIVAIQQKMMKLELDPVYNWKERLQIFKEMKATRSQILRTKRRAHRKNIFLYQAPLIGIDFVASAKRFVSRPISNLLGVLDRLLLDPVRWFIKVVRSNMGYSIALAIYSPFTFFFITQPLNPQAMWAVGKVRTAYIDTTDVVKNVFGTGTVAAGTTAVTYAAISNQKQNQTPTNSIGNMGGTVAAPLATSALGLNDTSSNSYSALRPSLGNLLLSTDVAAVNQQTWDDRMSNFKAMQIAYEGNLEIAPRFGRLEQMETQLNWPLIVEGAWLATDRYLDQLNTIQADASQYTPAILTYVAAEKARTEQVQLYLWDRNTRFILDHPYTMMDQSKEQTQLDYYVGRSFVLLRDMTNELSARYTHLQLPKGYDGIEKLAQHFEGDYKGGNSIFERLKNNSKLFEQKDPFSTAETRSYMKRQWEILYLLQNHTQEASNNGLQMYNWSIRNAIYILQSLDSTKHEELMEILPYFRKTAATNGSVNTSSVLNHLRRTDSQYEALFHLMVLEYTSIRKEIGENLKQDIEATQRRTMIDNTESFLKDREALLKGAKLL